MFQETTKSSELIEKAVRLSQIWKNLPLTCLNKPREDFRIQAGFASDILSDVLAGAPAGSIWVTTQTNLNVIAVAAHVKIFTIIFSSGLQPDNEVIQRAGDEGIGLYSSSADTFEVVGRLFGIGIRGKI